MKKGSFGKLGSDLEYDTIQTEHNFGSERRFLDYVQRMGYDRKYKVSITLVVSVGF